MSTQLIAPNGREKKTRGRPAKQRRPRLTLAVGEYDRTRALLDGRVKAEGLDLDARNEPVGEFCRRPVYELYDAAEMSFSWYVMARERREPVIALPIFPLRMWVHAFLFCRSDSPYTSPRELVGKRIGVTRYRWTINLWVRGILQEHYGVAPEDCRWITTEEEGADFEVPANIPLTLRRDQDIEALLLDGEVDALLLPTPAKLFQRRDPRIRRLFPDCLGEVKKYFAATKIYPITHTVVMNETVWREKPWAAASLVEAFKAAQAECDKFYLDPKRLSLVQSTFIVDEEREIFGPEPWAHGVEPNRRGLETFVRYAREQGFISREPKLEDLFAANTLGM